MRRGELLERRLRFRAGAGDEGDLVMPLELAIAHELVCTEYAALVYTSRVALSRWSAACGRHQGIAVCGWNPQGRQ